MKTTTEAAGVIDEKAIASDWAFALRSRSWALRFSAWAAPGQLQAASEAGKTITEAAGVTDEKAIASVWAFARRSRSWALRFSAWAAPGQLQEATSLHPAAVALSTRRSASRSMA